MDTLNLREPSESSRPPTFSPPPSKPKDPATAFFLSLLVPGLGQMYCGEKKRGALTLLFFLLGAGLVVGLFGILGTKDEEFLSVLWGVGLRTSLVLYTFGFLDAYFTAREMTEGTYSLREYNPRVAAVLNLLTRGFGYWYLDEKKKGVVLFFLIGAADRVALRMENEVGTLVGVFVEIALAVLAVDAFRLAGKKNEKWLASRPMTAEAIAPSSGLNPIIPLGLAGLLALGYVSLVAIGILMPEDTAIDQVQATIQETDSGKDYANQKYGVALHVPPGWELDNTTPEHFVEASGVGGACSVIFLQEVVLPLGSLESFGGELGQEIQRSNPGFRVVEQKPARLANLAAREVVFSTEVEGTKVQQKYVFTRKGFLIYVLVVTTVEPFQELCGEDIQQIRESVVLPR